ncbi:response regulator transcription factor [Hyphomicrobium sp.]|uniref:response regulator transcription factor n=1 Tax=Hyphomicrobium sp. TaxID=82 RepID=UPI002FE166E3
MGARLIVVADPIPLFRDALVRLIRQNAADVQIFEADGPDEIQHDSFRTSPVLFVIGLTLRGRNADSGIRCLRDRHPDCAILIISPTTRSTHTQKLLDSGADECLPRTATPDVIAGAIRALIQNTCSAVEAPWAENPNIANLTPRQRQILDQLALGRTNKEIAVALGISHYTVRVHISSLLRLLGVRSRAAAVAAASGFRP